MIREFTNKVYDAADNCELDWKTIAEACLSYMSEDDIKDMVYSNDWLFLVDEEEEGLMMKSKYPSLNPSQLRYEVEKHNAESHFFDRKTMKFFGDTMRNFGCYRDAIRTAFSIDGEWEPEGIDRDVYVLYRKNVKRNQNKVAGYFCCITFKKSI